ncbi:MAG: hypothetical protein ACI94Y_002041 [Maribacter sp.]|jgi:hypothetical protein
MKTGVATLVAAVIFFIWSFLSWSMLNVHQAEVQYTPNQDSIISALSENISKTGSYMIPRSPPDASAEDEKVFMENMAGNPWAKVEYHQSYNVNIPMNLFRGFAVNLLVAYLTVWILTQFKENNFLTTFLASLAVGAIAYLTIPYTNSIWFEGNTMGYIVDWIVSWGLVGAWLGWWLNR